MKTMKWKPRKFAIEYRQTRIIPKTLAALCSRPKRESTPALHHVLIARRYLNPGHLEIPVRIKYISNGKACRKKVMGIIDTGCSRTSISNTLASDIGLEIVDTQYSYGSTGTPKLMPSYQSQGMIIGKFFEIAPSIVSSIDENPDGIQVLIGLDILRRCDFSLTMAGNTNIMVIKAY